MQTALTARSAGAIIREDAIPRRCPAVLMYSQGMALKRMDNVGIVFDDLQAAVAFFTELGLELEGGQTVEGEWVDQTVGLKGVRSEIAMMRTPDGHGRLELATYHAPVANASEPRVPPPNTLGLHRVMFAVDDIDEVLGRLRTLGAEVLGEVAQYEEMYRLCYIRGPEGIIIALAQEIG
jgi:catechol 2,3-dioxygenase-like lactoylglutathione lyase family enzyme